MSCISMLKRLIKKMVWNFSGGYKPREFWDKFADHLFEDKWQVATHKQHEWILKKVRETKPKNILEVGCGFGRNIKFLIENGINSGMITGVDISPKMIERAKNHVPKGVRFLVADTKSLPFKEREFDVVLVHGLFMHIPPKEIQKAIGEAIRVTKKVLIDVEQNYAPSSKDQATYYTFVHDYQKIFRENNASIQEYAHNKKEGLDYFYVKVR